MEERENTKELAFSVWETDWSEDVQDAVNGLIDEFDAYNTTNPGYIKVTVVYVQEDEVEDE